MWVIFLQRQSVIDYTVGMIRVWDGALFFIEFVEGFCAACADKFPQGKRGFSLSDGQYVFFDYSFMFHFESILLVALFIVNTT